MFVIVIQLIFLTFIAIPTSAMNEQKAIVHSLLTNKYEIPSSSTNLSTRPIIQPLPKLSFNNSTIRAQHAHVNPQDHDLIIANFKKITANIPDDLAILHPTTKRACQSLHNAVKQLCFAGNKQAQTTLIDHSIQKFFIGEYAKNNDRRIEYFIDDSIQESLATTYALELLDVTKTLINNNVAISLTNTHRDNLIQLKENASATIAYIIQSSLYLQAHNQIQRDTRFSILNTQELPENPEIEAICQFFINYGDHQLSLKDATKKFVSTIIAQKDIASFLSDIAHMPICSTIISTLQNAQLNEDDPTLPYLNCVIAELYYYSHQLAKAHEFYSAVADNTLSGAAYKTTKKNAFHAAIATIETFTPDTIQYLSLLSSNVTIQLSKFIPSDPDISYHVALLSHELLKNNINDETKTFIISHALNHIVYAQNNKVWSEKIKKNMLKLSETFHSSLATIFETKNDIFSCLMHTKHALEHRLQQRNHPHDYATVQILTQTEQNNSEWYSIHTPWINTIIRTIYNGHTTCTNKSKDYDLLPIFISSELCQRLLPYCERICTTNTNINDDIIHLIAAASAQKNNYDNAYLFINKLSQPLSKHALLLKGSIYTAKQKALSLDDAKAIFKLFLNDKKTSAHHHNIITNLLPFSLDFFIKTKDYPLALKIINKIMLQKDTLPVPVIQLIFEITQHLSEDAYEQEWLNELTAHKLNSYHKFDAASCYDGCTNARIGILLAKKNTPHDYGTLLTYLITAVDDNTLPKTIHTEMQRLCGAYYNEWAINVADDKEKCFNLINKAMKYDQTGLAQHQKAIFLLKYHHNQADIYHALELLEEIIQKNKKYKAIAQFTLAKLYLRYGNNAEQSAILEQFIPFDMDKGMSYLKAHDGNSLLLTVLCSILAGKSTFIDADKQEKYINFKQALEYINLLINLHGNSLKSANLRMYINSELDNYQEAIADIDYMLSAPDVSDQNILTKDYLLKLKLEFLLKGTLNENAYRRAIECCKEVRTHNQNSVIRFNALPILAQQTQQFITTKNMADYAIEWCCFAADSDIQTLIKTNSKDQPTSEQKNLASYLLSAAKMGNVHAQLIVIPYHHAINYRCSADEYCELLTYARAGLLNFKTNPTELTLDRDLLIKLLYNSTKEGIALAYFILCNCYKDDRQNFEKTMILFSQAKKQTYYLNHGMDLIAKIRTSCRDTLRTYVEPYVNNPNQGSLLGALATFTLGAMYHYDNEQNGLTTATFYLKNTVTQLDKKFKLSHFTAPTQMLLANAYYKNALLEESEAKINTELLQKSIDLKCLPAAHKMAQIYIQQYTDKQTVPVNIDTFLPVIHQDIINNNPCDPTSLELFEACMSIAAKLQNNNAAFHVDPESKLLYIVADNLQKQGAPQLSKDFLQKMSTGQINLGQNTHPKSLKRNIKTRNKK